MKTAADRIDSNILMKHEGNISIELKNRLDDLKKLNQALEKLADKLGLAPKCKCETNLVLEELFTNIINHGFTDNSDHDIDISVRIEGDELIIRIQDDGVPFNPMEAQEPDLSRPIDKREIGGLGIYFALHFADNIDYKRQGNKNILTIRKAINRDLETSPQSLPVRPVEKGAPRLKHRKKRTTDGNK
ncbi:MAG: ATP-binding protein [Desulfobacteraceae bacterium]|nr:ATP-binding protein [Desulfobacteraceae bacterium]